MKGKAKPQWPLVSKEAKPDGTVVETIDTGLLVRTRKTTPGAGKFTLPTPPEPIRPKLQALLARLDAFEVEHPRAERHIRDLAGALRDLADDVEYYLETGHPDIACAVCLELGAKLQLHDMLMDIEPEIRKRRNARANIGDGKSEHPAWGFIDRELSKGQKDGRKGAVDAGLTAWARETGNKRPEDVTFLKNFARRMKKAGRVKLKAVIKA